MKILILTNSGMGLYTFRLELIKKLLSADEVILSFPKDNAYDNKFVKMGCKFSDIAIQRRSANPFHDIKLFAYYLKTIKKEKPQVVLTYTIKPNIYGGMACMVCRVPYLVNITGVGSAVENSGLLHKIVMILYRIGIKKAKCIFFQNEKNMELFQKAGILHDNYRLIPGSGVNLEHFSLQEYPDKDTVDFVFISRIMKEKGIEQYLEAAEYIRKKYPYTRFHICGFCEENYTKILKEYQEKNIVLYHGLVEDIREILKIIHCTVHPSFYAEGMSNVLLESAASGRPIITTDRSGCRETLIDGVTGYLIRERDSQDLISKIENFLSLSRKQQSDMGLEGRRYVEKKFDRNIVINAYLQQINSVRQEEH